MFEDWKKKEILRELAIQRELEHRRKVTQMQSLYDGEGLIPTVQRPSSTAIPSHSPNIGQNDKNSRIKRSASMERPKSSESSLSLNKQMETKSDNFYCSICRVPCSLSISYERHLNGRKHKLKLQELEIGKKHIEEQPDPANQCAGCRLPKIWGKNDELLKARLAGDKHMGRFSKLEVDGRDGKDKNWCGVSNIGCTSDHGYPSPVNSEVGLLTTPHLWNQQLPSSIPISSPRPNTSQDDTILGIKLSAPIERPESSQSSLSPIRSMETKSDNFYCSICQVPCRGNFSYKQHLEGRKHKVQLQKLEIGKKHIDEKLDAANLCGGCGLPKIWCMNDELPKARLAGGEHMGTLAKLEVAGRDGKDKIWCQLCNIGCRSEESLNRHFSGKRHKRELQKLENAEQDGNEKAKLWQWCPVCKVWCQDEFALTMHLQGKEHFFQLHEYS